MGAEYKVDTEQLQTQIDALSVLLAECQWDTTTQPSSAKDCGQVHSSIAAAYEKLQGIQNQFRALVTYSKDYFQKYLDAVLGNDKTTVVSESGSISGSITANEAYEIPSNRGRDATPHFTNNESARSSYAYEEVIKGFDVEHEARYQMDPNGDTWCNVYVADVTSAMNAPIPHYCDPSTGAPMSKADSGGTWLNANAMRSWLNDHGSNYGWISCTREEAIVYANSGRPTVATGVGHIAMVAPQHEGEDGVMLAQAGGEVSSHISINQCWTRHDQNELQYFYHL